MDDDDLDRLTKVIEQSKVLKTLHLSDNELTLADGKLTNAIAKNATLKKLDLSSNSISLEGVKHLANALKENKTLQEINLAGNNIGDEGAKYIGDMLAINKTLQVIELNLNDIGDEGAQSIATSLSEDTGLQRVYLKRNKITDVGAEKLADALIDNHSIKTLDLSNDIEIEDMRDRIKAILSGNNISKDVMDRIKALTLLDLKTRVRIANNLNDTTKKDKDVDKNQSEPPNKRLRKEDATSPKELILKLDYEHTHCSICASKFSTDTDSRDENVRKHLPVLSASKTCDHYFCHGCILRQQAAIAEENDGKVPKWIPCMYCKTQTAFRPSEPKYHRLLIDILKQAEWVDAPKVKEEPNE